MSTQTFYFCFGSNLLTSRMRIANPDASKYCVARLKDWRLVFSGTSHRWQGSPANILPSPGDCVWGVVWTISDVAPLDAQEVHYRPIQVTVERVDAPEELLCRSYTQLEKVFQITPDGIPSLGYKNVMLAGAREHELPPDYVQQLEQVPDNGRIPEKMARLVPECSGSRAGLESNKSQ